MAVALVALAVLAIVGIGVEGKLRPTSLNVPGTDSARATELLREHFGDSAPFAVLLEGPPAALDAQAPGLIAALRRDPRVSTLSPWDRGSLDRLRPRPDRALILVDFHVPIEEAVEDSVPRLDRALDQRIAPPVRATESGFASISRALQRESIDATRRGELIALPFLIAVLLLVFRSPLAAAIPLAFGAATVLSSRGLLAVASNWISIDGFALSVASMMGLALGVDYALLMVSRFRQELRAGADPPAAAAATRATAGRTTAFAGSTLLIAMLVSAFLLPGSLLVSLAGTVVIVTALAVLGAWLLGPALLTLVGHNIDRWRLGAERERSVSWMAWVDAALHRPLALAGLIGLALLALAAPALALRTGAPGPEQLPRDDPARLAANRIADEIGPGWSAPFVVVAAARDGALTEPQRLEALESWQRRIAEEHGVEAVVGPAEISRRVEPLRSLGRRVLARGPGSDVFRLGRALRRGERALDRMRAGLSRAIEAARAIAGGAGDAEPATAALLAALSEAAAADAQAESALERFAGGAQRLAAAQQRAYVGALNLQLGLGSLRHNLRLNDIFDLSAQLPGRLEGQADAVDALLDPAAVAGRRLQDTVAELEQMTVGQTDPRYAAALAAARDALAAVSGTDPVTGQPFAPGYSGLTAELTALRASLTDAAADADRVGDWLDSTDYALDRMHDGATLLTEAEAQLTDANEGLGAAAARLAGEASALGAGLERAQRAVARIAGGAALIDEGALALERGLARALRRSVELDRGLRRAGVAITSSRRNLDRLRRDSPALFDSRYFVLSVLDGARPAERDRAGRVVDLEGGGRAAVILAVPDSSLNTPGSVELGDRLRRDATALGRDADARTALAGGAAQLADYDRATTTRIPIVIAAITLITFCALVAILRALPLAAIAVVLNLVTVAAAFGVLTLMFGIPDGLPFGGTSYVDAVGAAAIFGVVFGLSIDYSIFLLVRMRERWIRDGDNDAAIAHGLERTAGVITGAAAIMVAVFVAYAIAPIDTVAQFGVGLTVAVALEATLIRLVLLPALMRLIGPGVWWLPVSLGRLLPPPT